MEILAIDVGGTKVDMSIVKDGKLIARDRFLNSPSENIVNLISSYTKDKDIDGVGIGVAGQVDYETGTVIFGGNIGWENFPLGRLLQEELNVPVFVEPFHNFDLSSKSTLYVVSLPIGFALIKIKAPYCVALKPCH